MKVPDISRLVICRIQLRDLKASRTSEAQVLDRAGEELKRMRQVGFNAVVLSCGDFSAIQANEEQAKPVHDEVNPGQGALSKHLIRDVISQAHRLDMIVFLRVESLPANNDEQAFNTGSSHAAEWDGPFNRLLQANQSLYKAEGVWFDGAVQPGVNSIGQEEQAVHASRLTETRTLAAHYPTTLLVVDGKLSVPNSLDASQPAPNIVFSDTCIGSLLADWRLHGSISSENLDELAAALSGAENSVHEGRDDDSREDESSEDERKVPSDRNDTPNVIIGDLSMTAPPSRDAQANSWERVYTALILTAPGIPMLDRLDDITQLAPLLDLRQDRHGVSGGLLGRHARVIHKNNAGGVLAYLRWDRNAWEDGVIVLINLNGDSLRDYTLGLPLDSNWQLQLYGAAAAEAEESLQFSEEEYFPEPASLTLDLAPHSYLVLTRVN